MIKIGTDIVYIPRMEKSIDSQSFCQRVFTKAENDYCKTPQQYAGIFAAKEAYFKVKGTGLRFPLTDLQVLHDEAGKPYFDGIEKCDLSISHDGDYAVASVVVWE